MDTFNITVELILSSMRALNASLSPGDVSVHINDDH